MVSFTSSLVLDTLKKKGIKATFFLAGEMMAGNEAIMKRQIAEGHVLASHSFSHPYFQKLSAKAAEEQIKKTEAEFMRIVGFKPLYFRFPYGDFNSSTLKILGNLQYKTVYWTLDSLDASVDGYPTSKI
jgi:peptidoglycan/xylan/chitin deacetylase (PgdA/CDA1 family)